MTIKQGAIVSLLWPRYHNAIEAFCAQEPGMVVITPRAQFDEGLGFRLAQHGSQLIELESLLDGPAEQRVHDGVNIGLTKLAHYFTTTGWEDGCVQLELDEARFQPLLKARADAEVPGMVQLIEGLQLAHEQFDVRLLVVSEDVTANAKTAVIWAKRAEIPSLQVMHGVALCKPYTVHGALFADSLAVYGQRGLESYLDLGVEPARCFVTGNPAWDAYPHHLTQRESYRAQLAEMHQLDAAKPWVMFATTWAANLTALGDPSAFEHCLQQFMLAVRDLHEAGVDAEFIIKDRAGSQLNAEAMLDQMAAELGLPKSAYRYSVAAAEHWVVAADVVIGTDSNIQVEAMIAAKPVVNLMNWFGLRLGPSFDVDSGVVEIAPEELAPILAHLITNPATREHLGAKAREAAPRYNTGVDGQAHLRVAELMRQLLKSKAQQRYIWQELLDVEHIDATGYHDGRRPDLVNMFTNQPKLLLDIGCSAGGTGLAFKEKYPDAQAWGIEINQAAAAKAATRLDKVLCGKFEDFDLVAEGIEPGTLDAVIIADVLEHMYNPWDVLMKLKPLLSPRGQVVTSIPNTRNIGLMEDLARGYWRYDAWGLLDITHIRFFTFKEIKRFFHETGYHIVRSVNGIDPRLKSLYDLFAPKVPCDIDCGKMVMKGVTLEELGELCSLQFYSVAELGAEALSDYNPVALPAVLPGDSYQQFLRSHLLTPVELGHYETRIAQWGHQPLVHAVVVASAEALPHIATTIQSLANQLYYRVRFTILAPGDRPDGFVDNERMQWRSVDGHPNAAINAVLADSDADWVSVIQSGDELAPHALLYMMEAAYSNPDWRVIYTDEDRREESGQYSAPYFKPDFCPDYFQSLPYIGDFFLIRRDTFASLGGFSPEALGASNFDLLLRVVDECGNKVIGHVPDVLYHRADKRSLDTLPTSESIAAGQVALTDSLRRRKVEAEVRSGNLPGTYRVRYRHARQPRVSVIMLTCEHLPELQRTLEGLFNQTDWPDYELLILDTGSEDPLVLNYLTGLDDMGDDRLRVYRVTDTGNLAKLRNQAAAEASGEYLLFLDNDATPIHASWLSEMMAEAQRAEVGIVGPRLLRPDGTIDDAGRILGLMGVAESPFLGLRFDEAGYYGRLQTVQNYSAVSGSCLLVRRSVFQQVGGMDEAFDLYQADHDLCLRTLAAGYRVLWTPYANLVHSRGGSMLDTQIVPTEEHKAREDANQALLYQRWLKQLSFDPAYNSNLILHGGVFELESRPQLTKRALPWKPLPRLLSIPGDEWGCGNYRVIQPHTAAVKAGLIEGWKSFDHYLMTEIGRMEPDTIVLQRQMMDHQLPFLREYKQQRNIRLVFEADDLMTEVPKKSLHRADLPRGLGDKMRRALEFCDRFLVTTVPLKEAFSDMHHDIRVVPNTIDFDIWGELKPKRRTGKKPRVGWAGGVSHGGDLEIIYEVVRQLADEVDWVFFGMAPEPIRQYIADIQAGVPFKDYPAHLASLNLDLAIAPLELNAFNECKSNLRVLEYGILGYPMIATNYTPYQGDYPITLVDNRTEAWVKAIREHINDLDETARRGDALRQHVIDHWLLHDHLPEWMSAWFEF
ncbi:glycosyltransferase [Chitinimonas taiwanensis]|uniref:Glycosyltransferase, GT2 family n=1 Tax=Chitinimonas taiwanensis DSM 18899 TaxID=1121279 RepID=A0A1K2HLD8_9NEIS|nr:glycosyltransferase [Chitinimonas taiwanensis]SFZ77509.1 Glycosyltransferase, GT2 family [Chitinimonas taiwanensis DSM 18899]